ncbi:hypothetical protein UFOVP469_9 [uncultured Caudovirales phage]|uniref:Uncharacterized protein n=1 Tax=uncultured Caudovirales phage TaxID=2100421 RepID=A0A6J5MG97_9CAUD|nr:hypothetical protein UFOVP469_9 [uncultured Caudovirales phage]CAB4190136.1 hypothetical protein UFOVP1200_39 [uncultured Caudovirales phage]
MALLIPMEIGNSGLMGTYWRIRRVDANFPPDAPGATIRVTLEGWLDQDARNAGKTALAEARRQIDIVLENAGDASGLTPASLYGAIKASPDYGFSAAENV